MRDIPAKVVYTLSVEIGTFIGLGILVYHSLKIVVSATQRKQWQGFKDL